MAVLLIQINLALEWCKRIAHPCAHAFHVDFTGRNLSREVAQDLHLLRPPLRFPFLARLVRDLIAGGVHEGNALRVYAAIQHRLIVRLRP